MSSCLMLIIQLIFRGCSWKEILTSWWSQWLYLYCIQCSTSWHSKTVSMTWLNLYMYLLAIFQSSVSFQLWIINHFVFWADIQFWNKNKSMEGLSAKSVVVSFVCQLIVFLYLLDNDTSWMILASSGVGCCIEFWKIGKAMHIEVTFMCNNYLRNSSHDQIQLCNLLVFDVWNLNQLLGYDWFSSCFFFFLTLANSLSAVM